MKSDKNEIAYRLFLIYLNNKFLLDEKKDDKELVSYNYKLKKMLRRSYILLTYDFFANEKKIFNYFYKKYKVRIFEEILKDYLKEVPFDENKEFIIENIDFLISIVQKYVFSKVKGEDEKDELIKITEEEYQRKIIEIIKRLDPTGEWNLIYEDMIQGRQIIEFKDLSDASKEFFKSNFDICEDEWNCLLEKYIITDKKRDISDIYNFLHEFFHCLINKYSSKKNLNLINEFLPVLGERIVIGLLCLNDNNQEECLIFKRDEYTKYIAKNLYFFLVFLKSYIKDQQVDILKLKEIFKATDRQLDQIINMLILEFFSNREYIDIYFKYFISSYLAFMVDEKIKEDYPIDKFRNMVLNFDNFDIYDLFYYIGDDLSSCEKRNISDVKRRIFER